jgi:hypothetical protein
VANILIQFHCKSKTSIAVGLVKVEVILLVIFSFLSFVLLSNRVK